jgi:DNA primase
MGEGFSQRHVRKITAYEPPVVYIFPDNDGPGHLAAEKIEYALRGRMLLKLMLPPDGMDPGDLTKEEAEAALAGAISIPTGIKWHDIQA